MKPNQSITRPRAFLLALSLAGVAFLPDAWADRPGKGTQITPAAQAKDVETRAAEKSEMVRLPGLKAAARVWRDVDGIPHIFANNEHDMLMLQGWVHARDRLFQMDFYRRVASGTLAEILGPGALGSDVEMRTIGLRRAAERSLPILTPEAQAGLEAYAAGRAISFL